MEAKNAPYGWLIKRIANQMEQNMNQFLKPYNTTSMQSWVLLYLGDLDRCLTFKELEKQFEVSQPTMVGILARLEQKQLVVISTDEHDKRIKKVRLSSSGANLIAGLRQHLKVSEEDIIAHFTREEQKIFHAHLEKAYQNIVEKDGERK